MKKSFKSLSLVLALCVVSATAAHADDDVKSVYLIPRAIRANDQASADAIRQGHTESVEMRYHMNEAHFRGGTFLEVIHHVPNQADETMGTVNYDDYQYSTGVLKSDFDKMWGKMVALRDGASILATGGTMYLLWGIATKLAEKKILGLSFLAGKAVELYKSKMGFAIMILPTIEAVKWMVGFFNEFQTNGELKVPFTTDEHCTKSFLERLVGNDDCNKTVQTPWAGFKGREAAERDWLHRVISQAYENSKYGTPIDEKQFDIDAAFDHYHAILSGQKVDLNPATQDGSSAKPATGPTPIIATVPMSENMTFAVTSMKHFFSKYVEENAEDGVADDAIPAVH